MRISFVIPAHNEEALIRRTIASIRSAVPPNTEYEIIVVDDGSTDKTASFAKELGAQVVGINRRQISAARNAGASAASGNAFIFIDADTMATPEAVAGALGALRDGAVAGGCLVRFDGKLPQYARILARAASFAQRHIKFAAGCFVFCSRDTFDTIGGFDETLYAGEEVEFSRAAKKLGKFVVIHEPVVTSGRKLRAHSFWTINCTLLRLILGGRRAVQSRDKLRLWYDTESRGK